MWSTKGGLLLAILLLTVNVSVIGGIIFGVLDNTKAAFICSACSATAVLAITYGWGPRGYIWRRIVSVLILLAMSSLPLIMLLF